MTVNTVGSTRSHAIVEQLIASGDPGAEIAALSVQNGTEERKVCSKARQAYEDEVVAEDQKEVDAMHQKADDIASEGWIEAAGMAVQGGLEAAGGIAGLGSLGADGSQLGIAKANDWSGIFRGGGLATQGAATVFAAGARSAEANDDAKAAQAKASAEQAKNAAEDMHDASKNAGDYVKSALDFYREYVSTEAQTRAAALHKV